MTRAAGTHDVWVDWALIAEQAGWTGSIEALQQRSLEKYRRLVREARERRRRSGAPYR